MLCLRWDPTVGSTGQTGGGAVASDVGWEHEQVACAFP